MKGNQGRGLDYPKFMDYLYNVGALRFLGIDVSSFTDLRGKSSTRFTSKSSKSKESNKLNNKGMQIVVDKLKVDSFCYGRLKGKNAFIMKVVME